MADLESVGAVIGALGAGGLISKWYDRRSKLRDDAVAGVAAAEQESTAANAQVLKTLLDSMKEQLNGYKKDLDGLRERLAEQERKIHDLELTNRRYESGQIVAPGYALVPTPHLAQVRKQHPGVLPSDDYPGESGIAAVLPITPENDRRRHT